MSISLSLKGICLTRHSRKPTENPANAELTYAQLALRNAERIMTLAAPFAAEGNQTKENLIALKPGEIVGNWRDSTYGLPPVSPQQTTRRLLILLYRPRGWPYPVRCQHGLGTCGFTSHRRLVSGRFFPRVSDLGRRGGSVRSGLGRRDVAILRSESPRRTER